MPRVSTATHLFGQDTLMLQRFLKLAGFDPGKLDGIYGRRTDEAANAFHETSQTIAQSLGTLHPRTERHIVSLVPECQRAARTFLVRCRDAGFDARMVSATRSYAEQDTLYAQGRANIGGVWVKVPGGKTVTKAKAGESWHNFGLAFDVGLFEGGRYIDRDVEPYKAISVHAVGLPLGWGGNWPDPDYPHYQIDRGLNRKEVRRLFEKGETLPPAPSAV